MRIHYAKEAPLGDTLRIMRLSAGEGRYWFKTFKEMGEVNVEAEISVVPVGRLEDKIKKIKSRKQK